MKCVLILRTDQGVKIQLSSAWTTSLDKASAQRGRSQRLGEIRKRLDDLEMPTTSMEEWRYSRIDDLDLNEYSVGTDEPAVRVESELLDCFSPVDGPGLVFETQNDVLVSGPELPEGISLTDSDPENISHDFSAADIFSYLNAVLSRPVVINVSTGFESTKPIVLLRYMSGDKAAFFPGLCINLESGARAQVIEILVSPDGSDILAVPVTKISQARKSELDYVMVQDLGENSQMIGHQVSSLGEEALFSCLSIVAGGEYSRLFTTSTISGPAARSQLNAAYFGIGNQVLDFRTLQEHRARSGRSELYFKGAAADDAHLVYSGLIRVEKGAISTDAFQTNRNLVLSDGARADSVPNLDIQENDVRCSHASSVGPIDADQKYYLESRGIRPDLVEKLIIGGFFAEMSDRSNLSGVAQALAVLASRKWRDSQL